MIWVEPSFRDLIQQGWEFTTPPVVVPGKVGIRMEQGDFSVTFFVPDRDMEESTLALLDMCRRFAEAAECIHA